MITLWFPNFSHSIFCDKGQHFGSVTRERSWAACWFPSPLSLRLHLLVTLTSDTLLGTDDFLLNAACFCHWSTEVASHVFTLAWAHSFDFFFFLQQKCFSNKHIMGCLSGIFHCLWLSTQVICLVSIYTLSLSCVTHLIHCRWFWYDSGKVHVSRLTVGYIL